MTDQAARPLATRSRVQIRIQGIVYGLGFDQYAYELAEALCLGGFVVDDARGLVVEVEGDTGAVEEFVARLPAEVPPIVVIERIDTRALPARWQGEFTIVSSNAQHNQPGPISPDIATCGACLAELADPSGRRYRYPFVTCRNCGPRYTIHRAGTSTEDRPRCADCTREYHDPADRHFHARTLCCPACGPRLELIGAGGRALDGDPIAEAAQLLQDGFVVAIKDAGGYHLAVDAIDEGAVTRLRSRKHAEDGPFAIMVADLATAQALCDVGQYEAAVLNDPAAPIVLLERTGGTLAPGVAPGNRALGVMLPSTPLQHLLAAEHGGPLVLTSGNLARKPMAYRDSEARTELSRIADAFLTHNRPIRRPIENSVVQLLRGRPLPLRRARGYVPHPIAMAWEVPRHVLAVGAERKNTVCIAKGRQAFLSGHIGDVESPETFQSFLAAIDDLSHLAGVMPAVVAHDLHPDYLPTKHAQGLGVELMAVQHHHAHIAACLADNGVAGPVIGVVFDGCGLGSDGTIWGGEILVATIERFARVGHLEPVPLPETAAAIREPWRMATSFVHSAFRGDAGDDLAVAVRHRDQWNLVMSAAAAGMDSQLTSGAERLFDAVAALVGVRDIARYHGQAVLELEQVADPYQRAGYRAGITATSPFIIRSTDLIRAVVADLRSGVEVPTIAARFHAGVAGAIADACQRTRAAWGLDTVALSGEIFQNALLLERTVTRLKTDGFRVLTHVRVPTNDGGISFGQVVVAGARDRAALDHRR